MPSRATQDRQVMVESSDKMWFTGEGNAKPLQYSCLENPMNSMKRQNGRILKEELPSSVSSSINIRNIKLTKLGFWLEMFDGKIMS